MPTGIRKIAFPSITSDIEVIAVVINSKAVVKLANAEPSISFPFRHRLLKIANEILAKKSKVTTNKISKITAAAKYKINSN
jgi:hypothetical protein